MKILIHVEVTDVGVCEPETTDGPAVVLQMGPDVSMVIDRRDDLDALANLIDTARRRLDEKINAYGPGPAVPVGETGLLLQPLPVGVP